MPAMWQTYAHQMANSKGFKELIWVSHFKSNSYGKKDRSVSVSTVKFLY